jgi:acetylornithine deacetylase/succinyl-diaminopimelate desuccinylase-like protein
MTHEIDLNINDLLETFLIPYLRIKSISADSGRDLEMKAAYSRLEKELSSLGFEVSGHDLEQGNTVLYAEKIIDQKLPTVLIYGHYDVQPINQPDKWLTEDPFQPQILIGKEIGLDTDTKRIVSRGADDNKGQLSAHILAMRYLAEHGFPCNIKFVVEGNEETGGGDFDAWVRDNTDLLSCDSVLVSDTPTVVEGNPAIVTDLKGYLMAKISTRTPEELIKMLHGTHDPKTNRTLIPGFYDGVTERHVAQDIADSKGKSLDELGVEPVMGKHVKPEEGFTALDHIWFRPTNSPLYFNYVNHIPHEKDGDSSLKITVQGPNASIHSGMFGGPVQEPALNLAHILHYLKAKGLSYTVDFIDYGPKQQTTAIQPEATAQITFDSVIGLDPILDEIFEYSDLEHDLFSFKKVDGRKAYQKGFGTDNHAPTANLSYRLVRGQDPEKIFAELKKYHPNTEFVAGAEAFFTETDSPYFQAAIEGFKQGFGTASVNLVGVGGSIPIIKTFKDTLSDDVILVSLGSPYGNLHGPNENFPLEHLEKGAKSVIYTLQNIGAK